MRWTAMLAGLAAALCCHIAWAQGSFAPYVPTPRIIVDRLLDMGAVGAGDYLIDLGAGDGRIVITAAQQRGARGHGIEIQQHLVDLANANAREAGVSDRVRFVGGDLFAADLSAASVVTLYLLPSTIPKLVPKLLAELKPGSRVVSHDYPLTPWAHERHVSFESEEKVKISGTTLTVLYLYVVPARLAGAWNLQYPGSGDGRPVSLDIEQHPDRIAARATIAGRSVAIERFEVKGEALSFTLSGTVFRGKANGDEMAGVVDTQSGSRTWTARRAQTPASPASGRK